MKIKVILATVALLLTFIINTSTIYTTLDETVLICTGNYATKYHAYECHGLQKCKANIIEISKSKAEKKGYKPCKICY